MYKLLNGISQHFFIMTVLIYFIGFSLQKILNHIIHRKEKNIVNLKILALLCLQL